ncbi:MAG: hypothetical protein INR71_08385, partial [Terriglobus roseus]|nr:hypothetical protein [Terriglobus roseus]
LFEQLKNTLEKRRRVTPTDSFYLGALGKLLATSITYPYITVKSRMHVAGKDGPKENMFESFNRIVREEGWQGLYGGKFCFRSCLSRTVADARRHWTQGHAERAHRRLPFRVQGRALRGHGQEPTHSVKQGVILTHRVQRSDQRTWATTIRFPARRCRSVYGIRRQVCRGETGCRKPKRRGWRASGRGHSS